jgi:hypothetical protein
MHTVHSNQNGDPSAAVCETFHAAADGSPAFDLVPVCLGLGEKTESETQREESHVVEASVVTPSDSHSTGWSVICPTEMLEQPSRAFTYYFI